MRVQVPPPAFFFLSLILFFIFLSTPVAAESLKNFHLTNGSVIKGELISYSGNTYTIRLPGQPETMTIPESYIQRIESGSVAAAQVQQQPPTPTPNIVELQNSIMSDPSLMQDIMSLMDDPEIMNALSNPDLMNAAMSQDMDAINSNPAVGKLMKNPKFMNLLKKIQSRISLPSSSQP